MVGSKGYWKRRMKSVGGGVDWCKYKRWSNHRCPGTTVCWRIEDKYGCLRSLFVVDDRETQSEYTGPEIIHPVLSRVQNAATEPNRRLSLYSATTFALPLPYKTTYTSSSSVQQILSPLPHNLNYLVNTPLIATRTMQLQAIVVAALIAVASADHFTFKNGV